MSPNSVALNPPWFILQFFALFPTFGYNIFNRATSEFIRMCNFFGWAEDSLQYRAAKKGFNYALVVQFDAFVGTDVDDIRLWQGLCNVLEIKPVPATLGKCREVREFMIHDPCGVQTVLY